MIRFFLGMRYIMGFVSFAVFCGALLMFWEGGLALVNAVTFVRTDSQASVIAAVLSSTDKFLFGLVLLIFAYAIIFGFMLDLTPETRRKVPNWMILNTVAELKNLFFQVIILYLVVHFATLVADTNDMLDWNALVLPGAIFLLAGAMKLVASATNDDGSHDA